ncbi:MAG: hypothetical protein MJB14_18835, partial [Spirochaetes bacterium]|nr:hypothetical protein [Spirochaetota bacterium]
MKIKKITFVSILILFTLLSIVSQDSRLPKEAYNWLQNAGNSGDGDRDRINVIFFEVPDTETATLYFAVNN